MNSSISIQAFLANVESFNFMNTLKGTPAYWKQFELEVPVIIKQLGLPTCLVTLPCTGLWILQLQQQHLHMNSSISIQAFLANDESFNFMNTLKGKPAYWKQIELEVPVIIKQLGLPTCLVTLPCTSLWILQLQQHSGKKSWNYLQSKWKWPPCKQRNSKFELFW